MIYDESVLTETERRIFALRTLYSKAGYSSYRMRKFEDYDLYSRNKDFLLSDRVLTFTDTNGRLKALKPDVTLSIVRNISAAQGERVRLYYDENVYRASEKTGGFKEIMQMGLECIGNADNASAAEVICLAEQSLALLAADFEYILRISDIDILTLLADDMTDSGSLRRELLKLAGSKNLHGIERLCAENDIPEDKSKTLTGILELYGAPDAVMPELERLCRGTAAEDEIAEFGDVLDKIRAIMPDTQKRVLDLSIVGDTNYYNGMTFEGYIEGIPDCVLVGGRYDNLMRKMKKKSRAIGFAVYLDTLAMLGRTAGDRSVEAFFDDWRATDDDD